MKTKLIMLALLSSSFAFAAGGQVKSISLQEAIKLALNHSYAMRKQNIEKAKLDDSYRVALANALPQIKFDSSLKNYLETPSIQGFSLNREFETGYGVTVSQALYTFGAVGNALDAADAAIKMQGYSQDAVEREMTYATKMTYLAVLVAAKQVEIAELSLKNAKINLDTLQNQFAYGRPPQSDILRINTDIARKVPEVTTAKSNLQIAKSRLKYLLGLDQNTDIRLTSTLNHSGNVAVRSSPYTAIGAHPQVLALEKNIEFQGSLAKVQRSTNLPSIGLFYSYNESMQSNDAFFKSDNLMKTSLVGLQISWNIWDGGGGRAKYHQALKEKSLAEVNLIEAKENLEQELKVVIEELPSLKESLNATKKALELAEQSLTMSRKRFKAGKTSVLELNDSETMLTQLRLSEALAMFKLHEAQAKLDKFFSTPSRSGKGGK